MAILLCGAASAASPSQPGRRGKHRSPPEDDAAPFTPPDTPKPQKAPPAPVDGARWQLQSYRGDKGETVTPDASRRPTLQFRTGRIIAGSAGCNTYTAGYTYDAGRLTVSHPAASSKPCPDAESEQERSYLAVLHRAGHLDVDENTLTLSDARGVTLLTYEREPPPVITGTDWRLTGYGDGKGGFAPALPSPAVTAVFGPDGKLSGSGGCNEYRSKYTLTGDKLVLGAVILLTSKACAPEARDQERAYLAVLRSATRVEGGEGELVLTRAGDTRVASFTSSRPAP